MRNLKLFIIAMTVAFIGCTVHGMKDPKYLLYAGICLIAIIIADIIFTIKHLKNEYSFMKREIRVYGRDISGTKITFTLKIFAIILSAVGASAFFYCCMKLGIHISEQEITENFAGVIKAGPAAKWLYGAYAGLSALIFSGASLVAAFFYSIYRRHCNKKAGFAERNVNKEDLSNLLEVEYSDDK